MSLLIKIRRSFSDLKVVFCNKNKEISRAILKILLQITNQTLTYNLLLLYRVHWLVESSYVVGGLKQNIGRLSHDTTVVVLSEDVHEATDAPVRPVRVLHDPESFVELFAIAHQHDFVIHWARIWFAVKNNWNANSYISN